jgi:hypothetical protein
MTVAHASTLVIQTTGRNGVDRSMPSGSDIRSILSFAIFLTRT